MSEEMEFRHDPGRGRFTSPTSEGEAYVVYREVDEKTLDFTSTWVPEAERGAGIGGKLVRRALEWAREHGRRVIPTCPFVGRVVERHPEYRDVIAE